MLSIGQYARAVVPPRHDLRGHRPARDRQRRRPLGPAPPPVRRRSPAAGRFADGALLRAGHRPGDVRRLPGAGGHRASAALARDPGTGRDDELPRRPGRRRSLPGQDPRRGRQARRRPRPRPYGQGAQRLPGRRPPLRPRVDPPGGGPRQAAPRHVPHDPRGHHREEPGGAAAAGDRTRPTPAACWWWTTARPGPPRRRPRRRGAQGHPPGPEPGAGHPARHHQPGHLLRAARPRRRGPGLPGRTSSSPTTCRHLRPRQVYYRGQLVAEEGRALFEAAVPAPRRLLRTVHIALSGRRPSPCVRQRPPARDRGRPRADHHPQDRGGRCGWRTGRCWPTRSATS